MHLVDQVYVGMLTAVACYTVTPVEVSGKFKALKARNVTYYVGLEPTTSRYRYRSLARYHCASTRRLLALEASKVVV